MNKTYLKFPSIQINKVFKINFQILSNYASLMLYLRIAKRVSKLLVDRGNVPDSIESHGRLE